MKFYIILPFLISFLLIKQPNIILSINLDSKNEEEKNEDPTLPTPDDPNIFYIPIIHSNDIHGSFYPKKNFTSIGKYLFNRWLRISWKIYIYYA